MIKTWELLSRRHSTPLDPCSLPLCLVSMRPHPETRTSQLLHAASPNSPGIPIAGRHLHSITAKHAFTMSHSAHQRNGIENSTAFVCLRRAAGWKPRPPQCSHNVPSATLQGGHTRRLFARVGLESSIACHPATPRSPKKTPLKKNTI